MRQIIKRILNNKLINPIIVFFGIEKLFRKIYNPYENFKADISKKSAREIAGFSHNPHMDKVLNSIHDQLKLVVKENCPASALLVDIGCGPGNYLSDFYGQHSLIGLDLNKSMIEIAAERFPEVEYINKDFLEIRLNRLADCIYCIGVLPYYFPSQIDSIFSQIYESLKPGGVFFLNFPHAISYSDTRFLDLSYNQYSPEKLRTIGNKYFEIIHDKHVIDNRIVGDYDRQPYEDPVKKGDRTYLNSYTIVFKKKLK